MKINKKYVIIGCIICLLPSVFGVAMWNKLPTEIPIHWNAAGEIDNYVPKWIAVFILPLFLAAMNLVCHITSARDKRKDNYSKALTAMTYWLLPIVSLIACPICIFAAVGVNVKIQVIIPPLVGLMLVFVGNYLPKCKQNSTMGVKLPWTLSSEENWNRTHRVTGWLWLISGLCIIVLAFCAFSSTAFASIMFTLLAVDIIIPTVYSFALHKKGV